MLPAEVLEICRLCLVKEQVNMDIFENKSKPLSYKIAACLPVSVAENDGLPKRVCVNCYYKVNLLYEFWNQTLNAEKHLLVWLNEDAKSSENDYTHFNQEKEGTVSIDIHLNQKLVDNCADDRVSEENNDNEIATNIASDDYSGVPERADQLCGLSSDCDDDSKSNVEVKVDVDDGKEHSESSSLSQKQFSSSKQFRRMSETADTVLEKLLWFDEKEKRYEMADDTAKAVQVNIGDDMKVPEGSRLKETSRLQSVRIKLRESGRLAAAANVNGRQQRATSKREKKATARTTTKDENKSIATVTARGSRESYLKCKHCDQVFENATTRSKHERAAHSKREVRYNCDKCSYSTYTKGCFTTHLKRHIKQYNLFCAECNVGFFNNTELTSHNIKLHAMQPFQCAICNDLFTSKGNLYSHIKSHDPNNTYVCEICGRTYKKKNSYKRHIARSHLGLTTKAQCSVCERVLSSKEHLRRHMLTHTDERNWVCSTCGKCFLSKTYLTEHSRIHLGIRPYKCEICGKCFTQRGSLTIHKRSHTGERPFRCQYCHKGFVMSTLLRYHLKKCGEAKLGTHFFSEAQPDAGVIRSSEAGPYSSRVTESATPALAAIAVIEGAVLSRESATTNPANFGSSSSLTMTTRMSTVSDASAISPRVLIYPKSEHVSVIAASENNSSSGGAR